MAMTDTDALLVRQVRAGDAEAWRQLIERFEGRLLAFVDSRLRDRAASEDVVQETFIGFLTSLPHYDEKRDMEAYLFSIAAHKLTDHLRKQGRRPIDQFGSDDHGRPLDEVPGGARAASSIARSGERRKAEERLLDRVDGPARPRVAGPGRLRPDPLPGAADRQGLGQQGRRQVPGHHRAGRGQLQVPDHRPAQGDGPPGRAEPRRTWGRLISHEEPSQGTPQQPVSDREHHETHEATPRLHRSTTRCSATTWPTHSRRKNWREWRRPSATRPSSAPSSRTSATTARTIQLHTLGAIWHRCRLTCPSRQQLGSYLLDALDPELAAYIKFHIEVVECPFCQANLADLERQHAGQTSPSQSRGKRFLEATRDLLNEDRNRGR